VSRAGRDQPQHMACNLHPRPSSILHTPSSLYPCSSVIVRANYLNAGKVHSGFGIRISFGPRISFFRFYECPSVPRLWDPWLKKNASYAAGGHCTPASSFGNCVGSVG